MKKQLTALLLMLLFVLTPFGNITASAETPSRADEENNRLTVHFYVQINGVDTPLPGAEIGIYQAAVLTFDQKGNAGYELLPDFRSLAVMKDGREVTFDGVTGTEADELVKKLDALSGGIEQTAVTDENGDVTFNSLSAGIYIVKELQSTGASDAYELFAPYYIAVPYGTLGEDGYEWNHEVLSDPKTVIKRKESTPESSFAPESSLPESSVQPSSTPESSVQSSFTPESSIQPSSVSESSLPDYTSDAPASGESAADRTSLIVFISVVIAVSAFLGVVLGKKESR